MTLDEIERATLRNKWIWQVTSDGCGNRWIYRRPLFDDDSGIEGVRALRHKQKDRRL